MNVREIVLGALEGTRLELVASFALHGESDCACPVSTLMPRARSVVAVGALPGEIDPFELEQALLRVDVALALARIGSRRLDPRAPVLPRIFDACGVWLVDAELDPVSTSNSEGLRQAG